MSTVPDGVGLASRHSVAAPPRASARRTTPRDLRPTSHVAAFVLVALALVAGIGSPRPAFAAAERAPDRDAGAPPDGLSVVGLVDGEWRVLVASGGAFTTVEDVPHPRGVAYHHATRRLAWIGPDARLRWRALPDGTTTMLSVGDEVVRHTQPSWSPDGERLVAVELPDGRSRRTHIVAFDVASGKRDFLVRKRTAQFEPELPSTRSLYYTTAICVDDCGGMIWELWERDLASGRQRQLTLMNAVATQPRLGADGWLYFSSDAAGDGFHLWRTRPEPGSPPERLTFGAVRDSDPVPGVDGTLRFLRRTPDGATLMVLRDGHLATLDTGVAVDDLRDLEGGP